MMNDPRVLLIGVFVALFLGAKSWRRKKIKRAARDLPPLINPFPAEADPAASARAYLEWVSSGKAIEAVAKRHAITAPLLVEGEEAKALRGHAYDVLATLGQKILGGVHVHLACNCDPPTKRGHEARAEHNCACQRRHSRGPLP